MVLSYYIIRYPYGLVWRIKHLLGRTEGVVLYCANTLDYQIFAPVQKHLKPLPVVARNKKVQQQLAAMGVKASRLPCFPEGVIMCRQAAYRFPAPGIRKIGMRHGAYHFKPFANPDSYNQLDLFFMTSTTEVEQARAAGIRCAVAVGYPKLDPAFDGTIGRERLQHLRRELCLDPERKSILFTATWDRSGLSAIAQWVGRLAPLAERYNILVTAHPWTAEKYIDRIRSTAGVRFIDTPDIVPFIMLADVCVGDASSILAECCALDKPMVTFATPPGKRTVPHVHEMIRDFSLQIEEASQLDAAIRRCLDAPEEKRKQRAAANRIMFDTLDGQAGRRAASEILKLFPQLRRGES